MPGNRPQVGLSLGFLKGNAKAPGPVLISVNRESVTEGAGSGGAHGQKGVKRLEEGLQRALGSPCARSDHFSSSVYSSVSPG